MVCLHISNNHIHLLVLALMSGFQHGIRFTHTRCVSKEYFQIAAGQLLLLGLQLRQKLIGIGSTVFVVHGTIVSFQAPNLT